MTLDVVPTGKPGALQVAFRGKPLPRVEVKATAQCGRSFSQNDSKQGIVEVLLPWRGSYLVHLRHTEEAPGARIRRGVKEEFSSQSFSTTIAVELRRGLSSPPRPPLLPPNVLPPSVPATKPGALDRTGEDWPGDTSRRSSRLPGAGHHALASPRRARPTPYAWQVPSLASCRQPSGSAR